MATYKISELYNRICEIANDGHEYVEIATLPADDDMPEALAFNTVETSGFSVDYEELDSCEVPEDYEEKTSRTVNPSDYCLELHFTYQEMFTIQHAIDNALEYYKECLKDSSYSKDVLKEIKRSSVECRNLQAKLASFSKHCKL